MEQNSSIKEMLSFVNNIYLEGQCHTKIRLEACFAEVLTCGRALRLWQKSALMPDLPPQIRLWYL